MILMSEKSLSLEIGLGIKEALKEADRLRKELRTRLEEEYTIKIRFDDESYRQARGWHDMMVEQERSTALERESIRQQSLQRIQQIEQRSLLNVSQMRDAAEARITAITEAGSTQRINTIRTEVEREIQAYRRAAAAGDTIVRETRNLRSGSGGVNAVFQIQQAIEDFSYAGIRGASNNVAFLASQMGGPAGLIALIGLMGVTLAPAIAKTVGFSEAVADADNRLAGFNDSLLELTRFDLEQELDFSKPIQSLDEMNKLIEKRQDLQRDLANVQFTTVSDRELSSVLLKVQDLLEKRKQLEGWGGFFAGGQDPGTRSVWLDHIRQKLPELRAELERIAPLVDWSRAFNAADPLKAVSDALDAVNQRLDESHGKQAVLLRDIQQQLKFEQQRQAEFDKAERVRADFRHKMGLQDNEKFDAGFFRDTVIENDPMKRRIALLEREIQRVVSEIEKTEKLGDVDRSPLRFKLADLMQQKEALEAAPKALADAEREALRVSKEQLRTYEQRNDAIRNEIKQHDELIKQLKEESQQQRLGFAESGFGTLKSMSANKNNWQAEQVKKAMGLHLSPNQDYVNYWSGFIDNYFNKVTQYETAFLNKAQDKFLSAQATAAGKSGNYESQRDILGKLQSHQLQMASSATNPYEANMWFIRAQQTQQMIEESYKKQQDYEAKKIQNLHEQIKSLQDLENKVKNLEVAIEDLPQIDIKDPTLIPWLQEVQNRINALKAMDGGLGGIGGKPVPALNPFVPQALSLGDPGYQSPFKQVPVEARASGGPITRGMPYLVGERGPEFIIPNVNGTVLDGAITKQLMRGRTGSSSTTNSTNLNGPMNVNVTTVGSTLDGVLNAVRQQQANLRMRRGQ